MQLQLAINYPESKYRLKYCTNACERVATGDICSVITFMFPQDIPKTTCECVCVLAIKIMKFQCFEITKY